MDGLYPRDPRSIRGTLLTPRPAPGAAWVALASLWVIALFSAEYWHDVVGIADQLSASPSQVFQDGEWWRLLTTMLVHGDLPHLAGNALALGLLSYLVYGYFGPLAYPTISLLLGIVITALTLLWYPTDVTVVGISGLIYGLATFWLTSFFLIQRNHSWPKRLLRCFGFSLIMLIPTTVEPTVSYRAHAVGALVGIVAGIVHFYLRKDWIRAHEVYADEPRWPDDRASYAIDGDDSEDPVDPISRTIH